MIEVCERREPRAAFLVFSTHVFSPLNGPLILTFSALSLRKIGKSAIRHLRSGDVR